MTRLIRLLPLFTLLLTACNSRAIQDALAPDPRLTPTDQPSSPAVTASPESVATQPSPTASPTPTPSNIPPIANGTYSDLDKTPPELRPALNDHLQLGLLPLTCKETPCKEFKPNQSITRREYTRWLVTTSNRLYATQPAKLIRLATAATPPAFTDLPTTDPDFPYIQALAETGLIPSKLSGDSTNTQFRPDSPLTREDLILWKVPIDTRQTLPNATIAAVQKTWGFQDTEKITPLALRAILVDHQNGDQANIRRAFGYTTLLQPKRPATRAEAAAVLWSFGFQADQLKIPDLLKETAPKDASSPR